jgi:hypothetical protein
MAKHNLLTEEGRRAAFREAVAQIEAKRQRAPEPEVVAGPWPRPQLSEAELIRRQRQLDYWWERHLEEEREREREAAWSCHVGPGDPDYWRSRR